MKIMCQKDLVLPGRPKYHIFCLPVPYKGEKTWIKFVQDPQGKLVP